jgi:hypothetical protein
MISQIHSLAPIKAVVSALLNSYSCCTTIETKDEVGSGVIIHMSGIILTA